MTWTARETDFRGWISTVLGLPVRARRAPYSFKSQWARGDLNPRPIDYESTALTN